jgi:hypothetical protein
MTVEGYGQNVTTFRTSRVCLVLGSLFILAGLGIAFQLLFGKQFFSLFSFCIFGLIVSGLFIMAGLILVTYKKTVSIYHREQKVMLTESSILGMRTTAFHFNEIMNVELSKDCECFFSSHAKLWVVKVYLQHEEFAVEKVFTTISPSEAKNAAETIAFASGREMIISCLQEERLIFSRI